ncbi:MAG TPA: hypothetical protein VFD58_15210 [Blastocatellia bacterium]|nr:hypothetical protein [Blastocatellia bacterium]
MKYVVRLLVTTVALLILLIAAETVSARSKAYAGKDAGTDDQNKDRAGAGRKRVNERARHGRGYSPPAPGRQTRGNAKPCSQPDYRQFDFWLGEWEVKAGGQPAGTNSVQLVSGSCALLENWTGRGGGDGKSLNFYNAATGKWHQVWVGSGGGVLELAGEYKDGAMRLAGETRKKDGGRRLERLTFFNLSSDHVRQLWEQSADEGKTWSVAFDGDYIRKK